jgi:hypothetical protein
MAGTYQITVFNNSPKPQTMVFFQEPALYSVSGEAQVHSNCLASRQMAAKPKVGSAQIRFMTDIGLYAGVRSLSSPFEAGLSDSYVIAEVPIEIASSSNRIVKNMTRMSVDSGLALSPPVNSSGILEGTFRIVTPVFTPATTPYNVGLAALDRHNIMLSNYIAAPPNQSIDVKPIAKFYVATGNYVAGRIIDFNSVSAALCDASTGKDEFQVIYNPNGTWTVN